MQSAFLYLPDNEPDASQQFNGHAFTLRPNGTTEIVPYDAALADDPERLRKLEWVKDQPSGRAMVRWPGIEPAVVADHIAERQKKWGVVRTHGPVTNGVAEDPRDSEAVQKAERQYLIGTKEWAEQVILADRKRNEAKISADLAYLESDEAKKARAWLASKESALRSAGLA